MNGLKQSLHILSLALTAAMAVLSIHGAFIGAQRATIFFNSVPLLVFWALLALVLTVSVFVFAGLRRNPSLLLVHAGCLLVLAGAALDSKAALNIKKNLSQRPAFAKALLKIYPNRTGDMVFCQDDNEFYKLPFEIRLDDFAVLYYDSSQCVRDYISKTCVIEGQKAVKQKDITVNRPLYFAGYHIYQHSWGMDKQGTYSVLQIVPVGGTWVAFAGFACVMAGVAGWFWKGLCRRRQCAKAIEDGD